MTDYALEVRGLCKFYRAFELKDVSFALPRGYIMGLIGPNGAGKTTIIKLIMNLVRRERGEIKVFGLDNRASEVEVKSRIGFVYDTPGFWDDQSLESQRRALGVFYPRWSDATFDRLAREFELPLRKKYKALSQGMKTKFALAMALSHDADLLIMDEPTSGLDPVFRREFLQRLSGLLQDEGKSILFSTHITSDLERVADFITFIRHGQVVFSEPTDTIVAHWAVVRGTDADLRGLDATVLRGVRRSAHAVEALVSDQAAARRSVGPGALIEKARLDDVMVLMGEGDRHAA
jgi:ABC-2 type transport system ATP-binding protein